MTNTAHTENHAVKDRPAPQAAGGKGGSQMILIGLVVLAVASLIAYQALGCAGCYGASWLQ